MKLHCTFCLLGPPSSGKGTIGALLKNEYQSEIITPGDIYRRLREEDSELGTLVRESLKDGGYCPDYLTNQIILTESKKLNDSNVKITLDGYPRTVIQLEYLLENFDVKYFIHLNASFGPATHDLVAVASGSRVAAAFAGRRGSPP